YLFVHPPRSASSTLFPYTTLFRSKRMTEAERINVFGLRTSRSVALYLENSINEFNPVCQQLSYEPNFIFDRLYHVSDKEVVILIALSPFTKMTYEVAKYCAEKNIDVILITDS